jgi:hypothetical protein
VPVDFVIKGKEAKANPDPDHGDSHPLQPVQVNPMVCPPYGCAHFVLLLGCTVAVDFTHTDFGTKISAQKYKS